MLLNIIYSWIEEEVFLKVNRDVFFPKGIAIYRVILRSSHQGCHNLFGHVAVKPNLSKAIGSVEEDGGNRGNEHLPPTNMFFR